MINKKIVWGLSLITLYTAFAIGAAWQKEIVFTGDFLIGEKEWKETKSFSASKEKPFIPVQIPGPQDATWAGDGPKQIVLSVALMKRSLITFQFFDSHKDSPPILKIITNKDEVGAVAVFKGLGKPKTHWKKNGVKSTVSLTIDPAGNDSFDTISIKSVSGSWVAIKSIKVEEPTSPWQLALFIIGLSGLTLSFAYYLISSGHWRKVAVNGTLAFASFAITIAAIEMFLGAFMPQREFIPNLRIVYEADDDIGFVLKANVKTELGFDTNRYAMRDYDHYSVVKPADTYRILVLGDSFTFSITTMEHSFPKYMERLFSKSKMPVEVLNAGVSGYGVDDEYYYYLKKGARFTPDLVVIGFYVGNDITSTKEHPSNTAIDGIMVHAGAIKQMGAEKIKKGRRRLEFLNRFHLFRFLYNRNYGAFLSALEKRSADQRRRMNVNRGKCMSGYFEPVHMAPEKQTESFRKVYGKTMDYLDKFKKAVEDNGSKFVIALIPTAVQLDYHESLAIREKHHDVNDFDQPQKELISIARKRGWAMYDPVDYMNEKAVGKLLVYCMDNHFNEEGNRLFAEGLSRWLVDTGLVADGVAYSEDVIHPR